MKYFFIIFCTFIFISVNAQIQNEGIKVSYNYHHYNPTGTEINSRMVLLVTKDGSKFFSPLNEMVDSMMSTMEGRMAYSQMVQAAMAKNDIPNLPIKKEPLYVIKSYNDSLTSVYDLIGADYWFYEDSLMPQEWEIGDSIENILGYDCFQATCNFRGRNWTAWFTSEIPIQDGPWKLNGLPGLILKAEDNTGQYSFTADGIQKTIQDLISVYGKENYEKTDRIKYLQTMRAFINNPFENLKAATGSNMPSIPKIEINDIYDFIETDYH